METREAWLDDSAHDWSEEIAQAQREFALNKALVEAGETFRAHKPAEPRRRPSPNRRSRSRTVE